MRALFVLVVTALLVPSAAAAPYLQHQVDAGRTGNSSDPGPSTMDLGLRADLLGDRAPWGIPLILESGVYALQVDYVFPAGDPADAATDMGAGLPTEPRIERLDPTTGAVQRWHELDELQGAYSWASDGERIFVVGPNRIVAVDVATAQVVWATDVFAGVVDSDALELWCRPPAVEVTQHRLVVLCWRDEPAQTLLTSSVGPHYSLHVLDTVSGELVWERAPDATNPDDREHMGTGGAPGGLAVSADTVYVLDRPAHGWGDDRLMVYAFSLETGDLVATWVPLPVAGALSLADPPQSPLAMVYNQWRESSLAVLGEWVAVRGFQLSTSRFVDGAFQNPSHRFIPGQASPSQEGSNGLCCQDGPIGIVAGGEVITPFYGFVHGYSLEQQRWMRAADMPSDLDDGGSGSMLTAGGRSYIFSGDRDTIMPLRLDDFTPEDPVPMQANPAIRGPTVLAGVGERMLVVADGEGTVSIYGDIPATIAIDVAINGDYGPLDTPVSLDLSGSQPGSMGSDIEFRVDWGDGLVTYWTAAKVLEHAYDTAQDFTVTVHARNAQGQQATQTIVLHPGQPAPNNPTFLEARFSPEHQESTFFVLGLLITLTAAGFATIRLGRRRARLRRELQHVDTIASQHGGNPLSLHRAMADRREYAKTLLVAGRLDESQFAVLERHIDQRAAGGRLESLEQDFPFLPMSLAATLHRILDDGRVTKWERATFMEALASDDLLTAAQKRLVASRIEAWFDEDA